MCQESVNTANAVNSVKNANMATPHAETYTNESDRDTSDDPKSRSHRPSLTVFMGSMLKVKIFEVYLGRGEIYGLELYRVSFGSHFKI